MNCMTLTQVNVAELIGDSDQCVKDMVVFRQTARLLSDDHGRMIDTYPDKWVALHSGAVRVSGDTIESVLDDVDAMDLPRSQVIVRFISTEPRTMILHGADPRCW